MSTKTPAGLTKPEEGDHTRLWEHIGTLADDVDARLPRLMFAGQGVGGAVVAPGASWASANDVLSPLGPVRVGSRLLCNLSMSVRIGEAGSVQTADLRLGSLLNVAVLADDYWVERLSGTAGDYIETLLRRSIMLEVTGTAGAKVTPNAKATVAVGSGAQRLVIWKVMNMITVGVPV